MKRLRIVVDPSVPAELHTEVKRIVRFAFDHHEPEHKARTEVHVKAGKRWRGFAWRGIPSRTTQRANFDLGIVGIRERVKVEPGRNKLVEIVIQLDLAYPYTAGSRYTERLKKAPSFEWHSWQEQLVHLAAHEARHIWQFINHRPCGEVDAEKFGVRKLNEYRRGRLTP